MLDDIINKNTSLILTNQVTSKLGKNLAKFPTIFDF